MCSHHLWNDPTAPLCDRDHTDDTHTYASATGSWVGAEEACDE